MIEVRSIDRTCNSLYVVLGDPLRCSPLGAGFPSDRFANANGRSSFEY
ncbi:hypothetical protein [Tychonema sp. LEGE 07203]|nr:hypothetical protein [Tychonema sp. LEGE 07203]MBE9096057.1 hypothetical protein [Tychonema sp. LEGE 07203]